MRNAYIIAANTLREALGQKLILLFALVAVALVGASNYFLKLDLGHEKVKFVFDFTSGALGFFGTLIAVVSTSQVFRAEFENRTIITMMSKPVGFAEFVSGKVFGVFAVLALFCAVIACAGAGMIALVQAAGGGSAEASADYAGVAGFAAVQWAKLCTVAAIAAFIASASESLLFSIVMSFAVVVACSMESAGKALGVASNWASETTALIFPNFAVFAASESFAFGGVDFLSAGAAFLYAAVYIIVCIALASWIFSKREL